ncbi:monofunctional biosynthetic peptidoglycan transglycosylase [Aquimarina sp. AD10]|uniref:Biosynthetic peptidoglycan transglycosylase n=1 Tax=Aquimarina aggregata TaxID=1642818 RepID=A0A162ZBW0_9FLAO|nr:MULTISPECIES: monofunctional biosynthetic peptidoglycan transglycosylase [Aquimarina]AXT62024.1 monofunctional biosynthetic peptidoglycan transglycosylase [Aquimarina sp. AD10]KZS39699.1 monofunctional biosynthetic peptidoglycan transglycosylase [Aquimarina aggregata]RKN02483.1 monofunctional biosynthetic peptidoglycan transglycosylase [Aquimarina sp. AD10]
MKKIIRILLKSFVAFLLLSPVWVLSYRWIDVPGTPLMIIRKLQKKHTIQHRWKPLSKISKNLQLAVICSEDQRFIEHNGFDTKAIKRAIAQHKAGKRLRGASTISQQTAKNVFLWPQRSWVRKGLESYFTFLIEKLWSKERILEVYLNSIEMGNGIYGAEAAAKFWFNIPAENLNKEQAAAIAAILPNPLKYLATPASDYTQKRKEWIFIQMNNYGTLVFKDH